MERQPEPEYMDLEDEAEAYAVADFSEVNDAFVARLIEVAGPVDRPFALDLGTGPGDIPRRVLRARPDWRVVGGDAAFAMLLFAHGSSVGERDAPSWVQADAKRLPFPEGAFDVVFSNSILHHLADPAPFWGEVKRVAKPGATIFLRDLARPVDQDAARAIVDRYAGSESALLQEEYYRSLLAAYTPGEVRGQLEQAGIAGLEVAMVTDRHLDVFGRMQ